jgi:two-component system response regulator MprA
MRILLVEDNLDLAANIGEFLEARGHVVECSRDGQTGLELAIRGRHDAVVLDIGLPGIDGLTLCRELRKSAQPNTPVIVLTARDTDGDRLSGFDAGADDYMIKPFDLGELQARLRALLRRANAQPEAGSLAFAQLRLDPARHGARVGEHFVELTRTEYQLLEVLMLNPRRVLSHSLIYDRVWGYDFGPSSNALRVYVGYLRRKLEEAGAPEMIHTVRGVGYALREP